MYEQTIEDIQPVPISTTQWSDETSAIEITCLGEPEICRRIEQYARVRMDYDKPPLVRPHLLQISGSEHLLIITCSHLVADGWSLNIILRDLRAFYLALLSRSEPALPNIILQHVDFAEREVHRSDPARCRYGFEYWRDTWLRSELDHPTRQELCPDDSRVDRPESHPVEKYWIGQELSAKLRMLASTCGVTLQSVFRGLLVVALHMLTRKPTIITWCHLFNRDAHTHDTVGWFNNRNIIVTSCDCRQSIAATIKSVHASVCDTIRYGHVPLDSVWDFVGRNIEYERVHLEIMFD